MNNPETRPETWPEKEQPPRDDRLTRLQRALGETAVRGAQMPDSDRDPRREELLRHLGQTAARDEVVRGDQPSRVERH
jgi:hypothetical protein